MREIRFRGVNVDTDEWAYGDLLTYRVLPVIFDEDCEQHEVDGETVGQQTGLRDKRGVCIFEGDIVLFGDNKIHEGTMGVCRWVDSRLMFAYEFITGQYKGKFTDMTDTWRSYEIIGNIHDNPELLEGGQ